MARHDEKTSAGRAKMLSGDDTGDRLAEVDEVLGPNWGAWLCRQLKEDLINKEHVRDRMDEMQRVELKISLQAVCLLD